MLTALQYTVSTIFFANKVLLLIGKRAGWLSGAIAAALCVVYFYLLSLPVYAVMESSVFVLMIFGLLRKNRLSMIQRKTIRAAVYLLILVTAIITYGELTLYELSGSIAFLLGMYYLAEGEEIRLGWLTCGLAHVLSALLMSHKEGQEYFVHFQWASLIVSLIAAMYVPKTPVGEPSPVA